MVVKVLREVDLDGTLIDGNFVMINKSGSFRKIFESNEDFENLIKIYGIPFYANIVPTEKGFKCTGIVRGNF